MRKSLGHTCQAGTVIESSVLADEMDEDLKFAIELSIVEARRRGENV